MTGERAATWQPRVTVDPKGALHHLGYILATHPEGSLAEAAHALGVCPTGLLDRDSLDLIGLESHSDRMKAPPFPGAVIEQPAVILDGFTVAATRRALHRVRETERLEREADAARRRVH